MSGTAVGGNQPNRRRRFARRARRACCGVAGEREPQGGKQTERDCERRGTPKADAQPQHIVLRIP